MITEIGGVKVKHRPQDKAVIHEVFVEDPYGVETVPRGGVVLDLGAHIGTFTLRCAVERGCTVYAYEPFSENFTLLVENVRLNGVEDRVKPFHLAVSGSSKPRKLYVNPEHKGGGLLYRELEDCLVESVECKTLKEIFEDNKLRECGFLKMDVERAEREIFNLESAPYFKRVRRVAMEWHSYDGHVYAEYLGNLGFTTKLTLCGYPLPEYNPNFARGMLFAWRSGVEGSTHSLRQR